jgi:raffinose/stachyose/melibiose transport system permease protein
MRRAVLILGRIAVALLALLILSPLLWAAYASVKQGFDARREPFAWPEEPTADAYHAAIEGGLLQAMGHSALITLVSVALILLLASLAAYAFARLRFRGQGALRTLIIAGMMVPVHAVLIPLFIMAARAEVAGQWFSLIGPYVAFGLPLSVLLLTAYFADVPRELEDAARLDGCSELGIWWHVILPMSKVGLLTVAILQGVWIWNEYPMALVLLTGSWKTLPVALAEFRGEHTANWSAILAGVVIVAAPLLTLFFLFQRVIMRGMTEGALKG